MEKTYKILVDDKEKFEKIRKKLNGINVKNYFSYVSLREYLNIVIINEDKKDKVVKILDSVEVHLEDAVFKTIRVLASIDDIGPYQNNLDRCCQFCRELQENDISYTYAPWDAESNKSSVYYIDLSENKEELINKILDKYLMKKGGE